ncbi:hypothetical protein BU23DRAFT_156963 [Bimuria novae-zelandiae CBS 107.79]|uniref:Uncharacterized protein n=1 Tax=Bimuria novae-zelandiae CBS 107.79 TaxID=1447943 RepID=A0A6A5V7Q1_9PLEO|nr:hypothetical protein BU23DRAFT_156963 [Bimuria novae-zelandiae CBS 107.79]
MATNAPCTSRQRLSGRGQACAISAGPSPVARNCKPRENDWPGLPLLQSQFQRDSDEADSARLRPAVQLGKTILARTRPVCTQHRLV